MPSIRVADLTLAFLSGGGRFSSSPSSLPLLLLLSSSFLYVAAVAWGNPNGALWLSIGGHIGSWTRVEGGMWTPRSYVAASKGSALGARPREQSRPTAGARYVRRGNAKARWQLRPLLARWGGAGARERAGVWQVGKGGVGVGHDGEKGHMALERWGRPVNGGARGKETAGWCWAVCARASWAEGVLAGLASWAAGCARAGAS